MPIISGFADEVSDDLGVQVRALKELGWHHIDLRTVNGRNVSSLGDDEFDRVLEMLAGNDIEIACFGSTVANWGRDAGRDLELDLSEMKRSIRLMGKARVPYIRIMSYQVTQPLALGHEYEKRVLANIREIVRLAEDGGVVCLHENCQTWGGQSHLHSLRLLEEIDSPALRLVFDTGNPVSMLDVRGEGPYGYQDPYLFFEQVRDHVAYLHIKDAVLDNGAVRYVFPGQGAGRIRETLKNLVETGAELPVSIEPHVAVVFHDRSIEAPLAQRWDTFIDYGRQFVALAKEAGIVFSSCTTQ